MKRKIFSLLLVLVMLVSAASVLSSCGGDTPEKCTHVDENNDKKCDLCESPVKNIHKHKDENDDDVCDGCNADLSEEEEIVEYPWADGDPIKLIFQMTDWGGTMDSGCRRYLAGEDDQYKAELDTNIATRNDDAEFYTNTDIQYQFWPDTDDYGWSKVSGKITANTDGAVSKDVPDIYCNNTYDMVAASLKSAFSNLRKVSETVNGVTKEVDNYFEFIDPEYNEEVDNKGYMYDYMSYTTLNMEKMYILASDYFTDAIRSFFVIPVSVSLLTGLTDEAGENYTLDSFYEEIKAKKWDYNMVARLSQQVYSGDIDQSGGESLGDVIGFALSTTGVCCSGMLYATNITVIERKEDTSSTNPLGEFTYKYPGVEEDTLPTEIIELFDNCKTLTNATGVYCVTAKDPGVAQYGANDVFDAVTARFCDNKILFSTVCMVGSLERELYQELNKTGGFGVAPVPFYHTVAADSDEKYMTTMHNGANIGAIARNADDFSASTAFLNYQSTHSTDILDMYYEDYLQFMVTGGEDGTVEMLQYIRSNVRSVFDKTFEDAIKAHYPDECGDKMAWHSILGVEATDKNGFVGNPFERDIRKDYLAYAATKQALLERLIDLYPELP